MDAEKEKLFYEQLESAEINLFKLWAAFREMREQNPSALVTTEDKVDWFARRAQAAWERRGHNSVAFTLDTYVDYQSDMQNEAVEHQQKRFYG